MTEKIKNSNQEKTLFDTEQQSRKERVFAAAGDYLSGRRKAVGRCRYAGRRTALIG